MDKFLTVGHPRVKSVSSYGNEMYIQLYGIAGETITIAALAPGSFTMQYAYCTVSSKTCSITCACVSDICSCV